MATIPTIWYSRKHKTIETMKRSKVAKGEQGRRGVTGFVGLHSEICLSDPIMMVLHHLTFIKTHTKSEPWQKLWTLGDSDMSMQVHQLEQMDHSGGGYW